MARGRRLAVPALALLLVATSAGATGPSRATVEIVPIAVSSKGVVLFKTWRVLNPTGAYVAERTEVGWLVVGAQRVWREAPHAAVDPATDSDGARWPKLREEFRSPFDWKRPPASVRPLLSEFGITAKDAVPPDLGRGQVTWSPSKLCVGAACAELEGTLWAPGGIRSESGKGNPIVASFYAAGVALFRCDPAPGTLATPEQAGAVFSLPPNKWWDEREGLVDIGYEIQEIDGIAVVPEPLR
jgi:hypothetical protein